MPTEQTFETFPVVAGPGPQIDPFDPAIVDDPEVLTADRSVVKIGVITDCGGGSGWGGGAGVTTWPGSGGWRTTWSASSARGTCRLLQPNQ